MEEEKYIGILTQDKMPTELVGANQDLKNASVITEELTDFPF